MRAVAGSGLGHLASCALGLRAVEADAIPEPWQAGLRRNLHKGLMLAALVALRLLVESQGGRLGAGAWSARLLREGGLWHLKPTPRQELHVIHGRPHGHSHLVFMDEWLQIVHRMFVALWSA